MALGTVADATKKAFNPKQADSSANPNEPKPLASAFLSEANAERFASGLCRMRGAALKVGQMLSIQDDSLLPKPMQDVLERVRNQADVMPQKQLQQTLNKELGSDWQGKLQSFDWRPIAAASIGQVHQAVLPDGREVVMKVQYPGVAESIESDINNLKMLIRWVDMVPKGLYLDETMAAAKQELSIECDYRHEAACQLRFKSLLRDVASLSRRCQVPDVITDLSTQRLLTTIKVPGVPIDKLTGLAQPVRNHVASTLLDLCLHELFLFRFMQTDPNWGNFLFDPETNMVNLIDFGASRDYEKPFVDEYLRMVYACSKRDREGVIASSIKLGFLTGDESKAMLDAHCESGFIIGEPFASEKPYDFVAGNIAGRVAQKAAIMLKERLTPPPKEAYTLHRKLSGNFLTCKKLEAVIDCRTPFLELYNNYKFD